MFCQGGDRGDPGAAEEGREGAEWEGADAQRPRDETQTQGEKPRAPV